MESQLLPTGIRSLCTEGTTNLSFVNNPDERSVNLTNASLNIENSSDVIIGNVVHHYHAPVTVQQITTRTDGEITRENSPQFEKEDVEEPSDSLFIIRKKINLFNITVVISIIILLIVVTLYFSITVKEKKISHVIITNNEIDNFRPDYPGKPSPTFANKTSLGPCKIIEEEDWGLKRNLDDIRLIHPIPLVIVSHSVTPFCRNFEKCKARVAQMQENHISGGSPDIGYNFIVGGDGNIYVGRGWKARNFHWGNHSIALNFIGNYFRDELTSRMKECAQNLFKYGEDNGILTKDYIVVCHNQTSLKGGTDSPGPNVCGEIKKWPHYYGEKLTWNFLYGV